MSDTLSKTIYRKLFTEDQWEMIYNFVGNALDSKDYNSEDVYAIRNKIEILIPNVKEEEEDDSWHTDPNSVMSYHHY
jgi:hypothetical protein